MYIEQLTEEDFKQIYKENQIIMEREDGSQIPVRYIINANGKFYNFEKGKAYIVYIKDYKVSIPWLHGPVKQQMINKIQRYIANKFEDYASDLYEHELAKAEKEKASNI